MHAAAPSSSADFGTPRQWLAGSTAGLLLWASSFVLLYGGLSLGCQAGWQQRPFLGTDLLRAALVATWLLHLLALAALGGGLRRWPRAHPLAALSRSLTAIAFAAAAGTGWPVLALPPCAGQALVAMDLTEAACSRN